jgi:membrane-associated protease RseP (regulator of RpoE activity)
MNLPIEFIYFSNLFIFLLVGVALYQARSFFLTKDWLPIIYLSLSIGLIYLYLMRFSKFDESFQSSCSFFFLFLSFAIIGLSYLRRKVNGASGFSSGAMIVQAVALAYLFTPAQNHAFFSGIFLLYFSALAFLSLRGGERAIEPNALGINTRPPLRRPKRIRGANEYSLAILSLAFCYALAGLLLSKEVSTITLQENVSAVEDKNLSEGYIEQSHSDQNDASRIAGENNATAPESASDNAKITYSVLEGETLKQICNKIYGNQKNLPQLMRLNPKIKISQKLHAGMLIHLPSPKKPSK